MVANIYGRGLGRLAEKLIILCIYTYIYVKKNCHVPSASVRASIVFAGPIPPELSADKIMTYMV